MVAPDETTAANLRAALARRKMTNTEMASRLGVSEMWVSRRVNAKQPIRVTDLARMAAVLGMRPVDLLGEDAA